MTKVTIDRELLEQVASEFEHDNDRYMLGRELRKVLDAPRQPEGDGLTRYGLGIVGGITAFVSADDGCMVLHEAAQRAIAELREECDTLSQQLADSDAALSESRANDMAAMGHLADMRQQRDKLAGLLADVKADYTHAIHWEDMHASMKRIDAALAEVNK